MRAAIANATPFFCDANGFWLAPDEWKSLSQWMDVFDSITLLKPERRAPERPRGWVAVPSGIEVASLCTEGDHWFKRWPETARCASRIIPSHDVLYLRMPNYEGYWCFREAKHLRLPIILELHGDWETAVLEQETGNAVRGAMKPYLARLAKSAVFEVAGAASGIISIGPKLAEKYTPAGTPALVSTNHLLDERDYRPRHDFSLHDPPRILFVGALQKRKGLHFLFSALDVLHGQGIPFDMVLAGTGPQEAPLRRFAAEKGFSDNVTFAGWVPHGPELLEIYRDADIFVLPSIAAEGVPRVTHEAMASGCPVIAADVGSIAWQLREGAGLLVPPRDAPALAEAVRTLLTDEPLRARLSRTGHTRSMEHTFERQREALRQFMKSWRVPPRL